MTESMVSAPRAPTSADVAVASRIAKYLLAAISPDDVSYIAAALAQSRAAHDENLRAEIETLRNTPVDCVLFCPACGKQHVDQPQPEKGWTNPPHRTHECQYCGQTWRPYPVATNGVAHAEKVRAVVEALTKVHLLLTYPSDARAGAFPPLLETPRDQRARFDYQDKVIDEAVTTIVAALAALAEDSGFMEKSEDHPGHTDLMVTPESLDKWLRSRAGRRTGPIR